jgi:hypothetical protein
MTTSGVPFTKYGVEYLRYVMDPLCQSSHIDPKLAARKFPDANASRTLLLTTHGRYTLNGASPLTNCIFFLTGYSTYDAAEANLVNNSTPNDVLGTDTPNAITVMSPYEADMLSPILELKGALIRAVGGGLVANPISPPTSTSGSVVPVWVRAKPRYNTTTYCKYSVLRSLTGTDTHTVSEGATARMRLFNDTADFTPVEYASSYTTVNEEGYENNYGELPGLAFRGLSSTTIIEITWSLSYEVIVPMDIIPYAIASVTPEPYLASLIGLSNTMPASSSGHSLSSALGGFVRGLGKAYNIGKPIIENMFPLTRPVLQMGESLVRELASSTARRRQGSRPVLTSVQRQKNPIQNRQRVRENQIKNLRMRGGRRQGR